ncbi:MAG: SRPBCC family protein [Pseudomonadaceae bacterium]
MHRLEQRWDQRTTGLEPMAVQASIDIACPPQEVWDFLLTPESAVLIGTGVLKAFRVPGTPVGVAGDQHCIVSDIGGRLEIHMAEVVEAEAPHRIVTRWPTIQTGVFSISTLTPTETGTRYTDRFEMHVAKGAGKNAQPEALKAMTDSQLRLKACVEAGTHFPSPTVQDSPPRHSMIADPIRASDSAP